MGNRAIVSQSFSTENLWYESATNLLPDDFMKLHAFKTQTSIGTFISHFRYRSPEPMISSVFNDQF